MSHHFDTPTARDDPRINLCDFYLFRRSPGTVAMAMTVNPGAGENAPDSFRDEGIYAFRFDLNSDAVEEVSLKVRFSDVAHVAGDEHKQEQTFEVRRSTGESARSGVNGEVILTGRTGEIVKSRSGVKAYAGLAPDLFAGDGTAMGLFRKALFDENRFEPGAFLNHENTFFDGRNVTVIVLEVPIGMIGHGQIHAWTTVSLYGHAPEIQVSRWGLPHITNLFMIDQQMREDYNRAIPSDDVVGFSTQISAVAERLAELAGSTTDPVGYARQLSALLCPTTLPYELDTPATFGFAGFNGRELADDVMDVMLTLATNTALGDGVAPKKANIRAEFPYFGEPYTKPCPA
jgi:hypothetical protein